MPAQRSEGKPRRAGRRRASAFAVTCVRCDLCCNDEVASDREANDVCWCQAGLMMRLREMVQTCLEKAALRSVVCPFDRGAVAVCGLWVPASAPQQIGADRVVVLVAVELQCVDELQGGCRTVDLGESNGSVQCDDRRGVQREQLVIEHEDLRPVGVRV